MTSRWLGFAIVFGAGCAANKAPESNAPSLGAVLGAGVEDGARYLGVPSVGPASSQTFDPGCIARAGNTTDNDHDNVPLQATLTFECTETRGGDTDILTGTEWVRDFYIDEPAWNFMADANTHRTLHKASGAAIDLDTVGPINADQDGPYYALNRTIELHADLTSGAGEVTSVNAQVADHLLYTGSTLWDHVEAVMPEGALKIDGSWTMSVDGESATVNVASSPGWLTVTPSCATRIVSGRVTGTYPSGGQTTTIAVTWTGCGQSTVTYAEQ